jgi:hypothetical protein
MEDPLFLYDDWNHHNSRTANIKKGPWWRPFLKQKNEKILNESNHLK